MCGIAGVFLNKKISQKELEKAVARMNVSQENRGPDDEGVSNDFKNGVFFGHRRLSILDLSKKGHQPMEFRDLRIIFNGEIYNFPDLKKELEGKGYKFKTKTDTEVILALYKEYGENSFSKLRGMFAFGLWDGGKGKLFLVKDRYGIKPLYYYADDGKIVFASTVKAIAESGLVPVEKNSGAFIGFLLFGSVPLPATTLKNVFAVPAGHYLARERNGRQNLVQYYDSLKFYQNKLAENQSQSAVSEIRRLLEESVNLHLISDAPLGVFLSGGLDSSAIAALAAKNREKPITTLSVIFDEKEFSEEYYSDLVVKKIKSDHREIKITKKDFYDSFNDIFKAMDQPTIDGVNTFFIAKAAKQAGLKAVLSGLGGDEIFFGYPHFRRSELLKKIQDLPRFLKYPLNLVSLLGDRYSKLRYFTNSDVLSFYLGIRGLFSPREAAKILDIDLKEVKFFLNNLSYDDKETAALANLRPVDLLSYLEVKFYLQNQLLKDTDFMSMRHSIEVRVPFLDHPLVEYLSGLPPKGKLKNQNKALLAGAVKDLLPEEIFTRPKMGFTFPFQKWLKESSFTAYSRPPFTKGHWSRFWAKVVLKNFK